MTAAPSEHAERRPLPPGWRTVRLGEVLQLRKDVVHPYDRPVGQATFVGLEHLEPHTGRRVGSLPVELSALSGRKPRFFQNDIVYGYLRPYLNKVWVAEFDGLCSVDQYVYHTDPAVCDPRYVAAFMRSPLYLGRAPVTVTPGQLPRIRIEEVAAVTMPLPPLAEQHAIVARIERDMAEVARLRTAAERQQAVITELSSGLLSELFGGHDAWAQGRLNDVLIDIEAGKSLKCEERPATAAEWGILKVSAVSWGAFRQEENKVLPGDVAPTVEYEVRQGDLLISRANTTELVGAVVLVDETRPKLLLSDKTLRLHVDEAKVFKPYLPLALRSPLARSFIEGKATGTSDSMKNISQVIVRNIPLPLPSLADQREMIRRFERTQPVVNRLRATAERQRNAIAALSAALLREVFEG